MFDFIRKPVLWRALNDGLIDRIGRHKEFHLKTVQDLAVFSYLQDMQGLVIAEIGGGDSRILRALSRLNSCYNIEKFEGADGGPRDEIVLENVQNLHAFVGERSGVIPAEFFDVVFSVSVVEHVPDNRLDDFLAEGVDLLKPGGLWLHAIDLYLEDEPSEYWRKRYARYRAWVDHPRLTPLGPVLDEPLRFRNDIASNPDHVMHSWARIVPQLDGLRQVAQSVSLLMALRKSG